MQGDGQGRGHAQGIWGLPVKARTRREQLLSGKFVETPTQRRERIKAENIAMRDVHRQKQRQRYSTFYELISKPEFVEWYEYNSHSRWKFEEDDDPKKAIEDIIDVYETAVKYPVDDISDRLPVVPKEKTVRQSRMRHAQPSWASLSTIKQIYDHRDSLNKRFPHLGPFDVDHIIPIAGRFVCGLHCEQNLRVIPKKENQEKSNKFVEKFLRSCIVHF